jgi:hypothetical protein
MGLAADTISKLTKCDYNTTRSIRCDITFQVEVT